MLVLCIFMLILLNIFVVIYQLYILGVNPLFSILNKILNYYILFAKICLRFCTFVPLMRFFYPNNKGSINLLRKYFILKKIYFGSNSSSIRCYLFFKSLENSPGKSSRSLYLIFPIYISWINNVFYFLLHMLLHICEK